MHQKILSRLLHSKLKKIQALFKDLHRNLRTFQGKMEFKDFSRTSPKIQGLFKTVRTLFFLVTNFTFKLSHFSRAGLLSKCPRMAFLIMVFLPIRTSARPRRDWRICCICFEPTLSTPTKNNLGYSSKYCCWRK